MAASYLRFEDLKFEDLRIAAKRLKLPWQYIPIPVFKDTTFKTVCGQEKQYLMIYHPEFSLIVLVLKQDSKKYGNNQRIHCEGKPYTRPVF